MKTNAICTIVAKNYLAFALTLAKSINSLNSSLPIHILVVDLADSAPNFPQLDYINWDFPLSFIEQTELNILAFSYNITEFCTAVKPFYLEYLLQQGYENVIYFDPDIFVYQPLDNLFQYLQDYNIILIPHLLDPIPLDGLFPDELVILKAGTYNLGFIGIHSHAETFRFISWWKERLKQFCKIDFAQGMFVDQKWIDLVPHIFSGVYIITDRGYNVAYWNLNARQLSKDNNMYFVDKKPLVFFHFSGFNPSSPERLSKYDTRLQVDNGTVLAELLQNYTKGVNLNGYGNYKNLSYGYSTFSNGLEINEDARQLLTVALKEGLSFPEPANIDSEPSFLKWLQKRKVMEKKTYLWNIIKNLPINCFAFLKAFYSLGKIYLNLTK